MWKVRMTLLSNVKKIIFWYYGLQHKGIMHPAKGDMLSWNIISDIMTRFHGVCFCLLLYISPYHKKRLSTLGLSTQEIFRVQKRNIICLADTSRACKHKTGQTSRHGRLCHCQMIFNPGDVFLDITSQLASLILSTVTTAFLTESTAHYLTWLSCCLH